MDGHCEYKFYTGATFSGKMRHGERFALQLRVAFCHLVCAGMAPRFS
jgi:hypothetical protein